MAAYYSQVQTDPMLSHLAYPHIRHGLAPFQGETDLPPANPLSSEEKFVVELTLNRPLPLFVVLLQHLSVSSSHHSHF